MFRKYWKMILIFIFIFVANSIHISPIGAAEPYVIGYIADITGMARANYAPECEGIRLYIDTVNARGGVHGHPIKLVIEDGKSDPAVSTGVAKKLIIEDKVLAIMGLGFSTAQPPVIEMARKERVAAIGGYTIISDVSRVQPGDVCFGTGYIMHPNLHTGAIGFAQVAKTLYPKGSYATSSYDSPGGRIWSKLAADRAEKLGSK